MGCGKKTEHELVRPKCRPKVYSCTIICAAGVSLEFSEQEGLGGSFGVAIIEFEYRSIQDSSLKDRLQAYFQKW